MSGLKFQSGNNVSVGAGTHIIGQVSIGSDVRLAQNDIVVSDYYGFDKSKLILDQDGYTKVEIRIGDDVWLGVIQLFYLGSVSGAGLVLVLGGGPAMYLRTR